ncbi:DUF551 domain-containing protein [Pseudomonas typographi]|uniref:DUF551 domain-containing protein n=1 Tax=Pseudomonas typographi TaxID=2715964 RepID=A0ABR7ZA33_9PSED|nr:DUF551 domain-containing protein [Pseudomonas typographi]MBD1602280.1 hypothetical protein [Pseudomonas typographi]
MSGWVRIADKLPPVAARLDEKCIVNGKEIPPLNRSVEVIVFNGKAVFGGVIEWFDNEIPHRGETHWQPLPPPPTE